MARPTVSPFFCCVNFPFRYYRASETDDAARRLAEPGAVPLGGGTDLLASIGEGIARPQLVVDLRGLPSGQGGGVHLLDDGSVRVDASISLAALSRDALIRGRYPALSAACEAVASPALRNMGTLGGNLCQRPRCWYFRRGVSCFKSGGTDCPAEHGENQYLAILEGGPCHAVHPSDPAVALAALDAIVEVASVNGNYRIPMSELYTLPRERADRETALAAGELVSAVVLPAESANGTQRFHKLMQRDAWDFALVSVAGCRRMNGDVRIVLGGVAPRPWRVNSSIEEDVSSGGLDDDAIDTLAQRALLDAAPLSGNGYKVDLAASLLRQVMRGLG